MVSSIPGKSRRWNRLAGWKVLIFCFSLSENHTNNSNFSNSLGHIQSLTDAADIPHARFVIRFDDGDQRTVKGADVIFRQVGFVRYSGCAVGNIYSH